MKLIHKMYLALSSWQTLVVYYYTVELGWLVVE